MPCQRRVLKVLRPRNLRQCVVLAECKHKYYRVSECRVGQQPACNPSDLLPHCVQTLLEAGEHWIRWTFSCWSMRATHAAAGLSFRGHPAAMRWLQRMASCGPTSTCAPATTPCTPSPTLMAASGTSRTAASPLAPSAHSALCFPASASYRSWPTMWTSSKVAPWALLHFLLFHCTPDIMIHLSVM